MGTPKGTKPWNAGKGKGWIDPRGYRIVSRTINGKRHQIREHRLIMEDHLGRALEPWEVVHHKNGDPLDNDLANLEVMTMGDHTTHHHTGTRKSYDTRRTMEAFANMREELKREREIKADLLATLEAIWADASFVHFPDGSGCYGVDTGIMDKARDAIAKARK